VHKEDLNVAEKYGSLTQWSKRNITNHSLLLYLF